MEVAKLTNVNVGVLGHVDSGKTSLCKALSTTASTAAFDSNPQSKERGITLDLGFSAFPLDDKWSVTLVDCPGHASLIRTVLGGVQIMDLMLLIVDIKKGMQPQTAECLILANICCSHLIVVLNKLDLIQPSERKTKVEKVVKLMRNTLGKTKFADEPVVAVSTLESEIGTAEIKSAILEKLRFIKLKRDRDAPFLLAVDHCFSIRGSGTVCTGTVLQGGVKVGDTVEFPELQTTKKVKTMQMFRNPVNESAAGDRVALGIPGLDAKLVERSVISAPGLVKIGTKVAVIKISRIKYYKHPVASKRRYHITIGYSTVTALVTLFGSPDENAVFDLAQHYEYVDELLEDDPGSVQAKCFGTYFALLEFDKPIMVLPNSMIIGSNLQMVEENPCRLAFHGTLADFNQEKEYEKSYLPKLNIFRWKTKEGTVDRIVSSDAIISKGFCKKLSNMDHLIGLKVSIMVKNEKDEYEIMHTGRMESRFGQTNKVRIALNGQLQEKQSELLNNNIKSSKIELKYKKYIFKDSNDKSNKLIQ